LQRKLRFNLRPAIHAFAAGDPENTGVRFGQAAGLIDSIEPAAAIGSGWWTTRRVASGHTAGATITYQPPGRQANGEGASGRSTGVFSPCASDVAFRDTCTGDAWMRAAFCAMVHFCS
jgi:hypothetical protein